MIPTNTIGVDPNVDNSVWSTSLSRIGGFFTSLVNEFMECIQCISRQTNSSGSYEKCGQIIQAIQQDPSDYTKNVSRDLVAQSRVGEISGGVQTGRVWGGYDECGVTAGSDGLALAQEIGGNNNGSEQPELGTPTSKVLQERVAGEYEGNKKMTAASYTLPGTAQFFNGDIHERSAYASDAAAVVGVRDGNQIVGSLRADGTIQMRFFVGPNMPTLQPGTAAIWGDSATGVTYFIFFDGGSYLKAALTV